MNALPICLLALFLPVSEEPSVEAASPIFIDKLAVTVKGSGELRYTRDGTRPLPTSPRVSGEIVLDRTATVTVQAFEKGQAVGKPVVKNFAKVEPWAAANPRRLEPGVSVRVFSGDWKSVRDFYGVRNVRPEPAESLALPTGPVPERQGRVYEAFLKVEAEGVYRFELTGQDGARLWIDGQKIVDVDSGGAGVGFAPLAAGLHSIRLEWFNAEGEGALRLLMGEAGGPMRPIDATALQRVAIRRRPTATGSGPGG